MPGLDPLSIAGAGIGGAFNYAGAKKQADAIKSASELQANSTKQALDFTKQQYADLQGRLAPYVASGKNANGIMNGLVTASPYAKALRQPGMPLAPAAPAPAGQMVTLKAPDGTVKAVPSEQAQHYIQLGATQVG